ncbi:pilus assembly protein [Wenzhouxiangella marina]|uniref:Tfp pilus assembly protein, tip-associated adhesin PilY1 n=1 Tax=Wenzhouxiangella marina TaxID=1579979 RepID=A0A0K0XSJ9_9GAMM|nr:PilC/PilY family type IV pilus protein [Wenzhouxiangella marina]AKS40635.1 Tfp pilus assembly protein, tip-associated adhesin PilY1 [Wenzhouxiangella marina]MBB6088403.1 type IV pilus assembly protein PilY1 [Wenzhouxiangella marina]
MMKLRFNSIVLTAVFCCTVGISAPASADDLDIAQTPLFVAVNIDPNIMFTLDDSGSMQWEFMPDGPEFRYTLFMFPRPNGLYGGVNYANQVPSFRDDSLHNYFGRSAANNGVFYNPDLTYKPWKNADGSFMPDADPRNALYNPHIPGLGDLDLLDEQTQRAVWFRGNAFDQAFCDPCNGDHTYWPITYYNYIGGDRTDRDSYERVQIRNTTPASATFTSPGGITRTRNEEIQNFANWFQYSRSRILAARNGIGRAFAELPSRARVGFAAINQDSTSVDGVNTRTIIDGVRPFDGLDRDRFYEALYGRVINNNGTPLRRAAEDVGEYFQRSDARGPWSTLPGSAAGQDLYCRQSFHILMTDGFWNGGDPDVDNSDNTAGPTHSNSAGDTGGYVPVDPYRDTRSNTLGDVAMEFWKNDLRGDLENRVPTNDTDPAFWQHLTTYGIGLGVTGALDPEDVFEAVENGDAVDWGDPANDNPAKIDDLLHFGINGRGGYFSASDPDSFANQLGAILADIASRANATTGASVSATRLTTGSLIYAASFDTQGWVGELEAIDPIEDVVVAEASEQLALLGADNRNIWSWDPDADASAEFISGSGVQDRVMANAPGSYTADALFAFLRGDNVPGMRFRSSMLGDIVGSRPVFSGPGNEGWARVDLGYLGYIDAVKRDPRDPCEQEDPADCAAARYDTVFVGSNDGMLHAFDARTMDELFAYVPAAVHENLWQLADPDYNHRFYVDGQVAVADALEGSGWGTFLVGTLGAGGRGVYALDVSTPQNFGENDVRWEFTAEDDPDLGYTYGDPLITRLENEEWVAIFGNGYNSADGQAYLYVLNLFSGAVLHKVPLGDPGGNGLSGVAGWREAATRSYIDRVYAGDLNGTMWRIDFEGSEPVVVYDDGLFTDPNGRPITATPTIAANPDGGLNVFFGTGKLIENSDRLTVNLDRFFAIRDLNEPVSNLTRLSKGEIASEGVGVRSVINEGNGPEGWYVDLEVGGPSGERVMAKAVIQFGILIIATYEPVDDPCTPGGIQRLYVLDAATGNGAFPGCTNCGAIEVGIGAPISPPIVIKQHTRTQPDGLIDFPGIPNPEEPEDPGVPPEVTDDALREEWCSVYGIPPLVEGATFTALGSICEGRQVWIQRR